MSKKVLNKDSISTQDSVQREIPENSQFSKIRQFSKLLEKENLSDITNNTYIELESHLKDLSSKTDDLRIDTSIKKIIDKALDDAASLSYQVKYEPKMRASPSFFGTARNLKKKLSMLDKLADDQEKLDEKKP